MVEYVGVLKDDPFGRASGGVLYLSYGESNYKRVKLQGFRFNECMVHTNRLSTKRLYRFRLNDGPSCGIRECPAEPNYESKSPSINHGSKMSSSADGLSSGIQVSIFRINCKNPSLSSSTSLCSSRSRLTSGMGTRSLHLPGKGVFH